MNTAAFRLYGSLNGFLPSEKRGISFLFRFAARPSVKDAVESLGVPHTEVDVILANGKSVGFDYRIVDKDDIAVYPLSAVPEVSNVVRLVRLPEGKPAFIGDVHLGRLCRMLRILGFDTAYRNNFLDREIVAVAAKENRVVLTRDRGLLKHGAVAAGYCVRSDDWREQVREVVQRYDLKKFLATFSRCPGCNGPVAAVDKEAIRDLLEEKTARYYDFFTRCASCGKIYWQGSHYARLQQLVKEFQFD